MKSFGINQYGNAQVIQQYDVPLPKIGSKEVLIKTNSFAINSFDISVRNGRFRNNVTLLFPFILGSDAVGRIVKVGKDVDNYKIGDDVIARPGSGTYAEYFKVATNHIGLLPNSYNSYEAAGLPLSGVTAYNTLVHVAQVQSGQTIVVLGASGGVGSLIIQMAKALGLYVIGTDVAEAHDLVMKLGADEFGGFDNEHVKDKFRQTADILVDATNNAAGAAAGIHIVKDDGVYVSLTDLPKNRLEKPNVHFKQMVPSINYLDSDAFFAISLMIRNGQLHVPVGKILPFTLDSIRRGQKLVESNEVDGKVIVKI